MIEAVSCGGVVIYKWKILLLYKNQNGRYMGWVLPKGTVEDVIIGISFPRYSMRTLKALEFANNRSAKVITITDSIHSPMNLYSSCNLIADSDMASIVDSLVAPLSVINALIVALCMKKQSIVAKTLTELEDIWNEYQVYENDEIDYIDDSIKVHYAKLGDSQDE